MPQDEFKLQLVPLKNVIKTPNAQELLRVIRQNPNPAYHRTFRNQYDGMPSGDVLDAADELHCLDLLCGPLLPDGDISEIVRHLANVRRAS